MIFKQYLPAFFDPISIPRAEIEFETWEELQENEILKKWSTEKNFIAWCLCKESSTDRISLLAITGNPKTQKRVNYYVVGHFQTMPFEFTSEWTWDEEKEKPVKLS